MRVARALPREERTEPGWNKALLFLASRGPAAAPPRPAELARMWGRFLGPVFPGGLLAGEWEELSVLGCTKGSWRNSQGGKGSLWRLMGR